MIPKRWILEGKMRKAEREAYCRWASTPRLKGLSELLAELSVLVFLCSFDLHGHGRVWTSS